MVVRIVLAITLSLINLTTSSHARAAELELGTGIASAVSTWRGDVVPVGSALRLGIRFGEWIAIDSVDGVSYATVDQRMLTLLTLGVSVYGKASKPVVPFARIAFAHQHEENVDAFGSSPFMSLVGIGDAIRHRAGAAVAAGVSTSRLVDLRGLSFGVEVNGLIFPESPIGPGVYAGLGIWGLYRFDLARKK